MSAIRTRHYDRNARRALRFLRQAKSTTNSLDERKRINDLFLKAADLQPVLSYLSHQA